MVLLVEGPDPYAPPQQQTWARTIIPRGLSVLCVAMGTVFIAMPRCPPLIRAMFFVDLVTTMGSESAVRVFLSGLSQKTKAMLLLLILIIDTTSLVAMLRELPEGWAAGIGRVLLFCMAFGCSAGCWASLLPGAAGALGVEEDEWDDELWDDEYHNLRPERTATPVHWPSPLELPEEVAARSRHELPEGLVCPLTMGLMRQPAITPRGTTYEYDALVNWISSNGRYPAGEAGALPSGKSRPRPCLGHETAAPPALSVQALGATRALGAPCEPRALWLRADGPLLPPRRALSRRARSQPRRAQPHRGVAARAAAAARPRGGARAAAASGRETTGTISGAQETLSRREQRRKSSERGNDRTSHLTEPFRSRRSAAGVCRRNKWRR